MRSVVILTPAALALAVGLAACAVPAGVEPGSAGAAADQPAATGEPAPPPRIAPSCEDLEGDPPVDGPLSGDEEVAAAQRARARGGLASDEATVRDVLASTGEEDWIFPFPHTAAEEGEIAERNAAAVDAAAVRAWIASEAADDYAGMWLDQAAGAVLTVAFVDRAEERGERLRERWGAGIRTVTADHPYRELEALQRRVTGDLIAQGGRAPDGDDLYPEPGTLLGTGVDDRLNRVGVGVVGGDDEALAELTERYGADRICLEIAVRPEPLDYDGPVRPLAKADGWRPELYEHLAVFSLVEIAYDRDTAERAWADNVPADLPDLDGDPARPGRYGTLGDVDFETQAVVVWSSGQSGSCPGWLAGIDTTAAGKVEVETGAAGLGDCTSDDNPYRMLLAVDRDRLPGPGDLPAPAGRATSVVAYPAR